MTLRSLGLGGPGETADGSGIGGVTGGAGGGTTGRGGVGTGIKGAGVEGGTTFFLSSEYCGVGTDVEIGIPFGAGGSVALRSGASNTVISSLPT